MNKFSTILLVIFMAMFWVFRIIVAVTTEFGIDLGGITTLDIKTEILLLFVVLLCMIFVIRRNLIGGLIYLLSYGIYFGISLYNSIIAISAGHAAVQEGLNGFIALIGVALPIAVMIDLLLDRNRKINPSNKKTDWYYNNEEYDRKLDERADKNNYRTL